MGFFYAAMNVAYYLVPIAMTLALAAALRFFVLSQVPFGWVISLAIAIGVSCIPVAFERKQLEKDIAAFAPDEVHSATRALEPGALLHLQPGNEAGLTCRQDCLSEVAFVTSVQTFDLAGSLGWSASEVLASHDLWPLIKDADRSKPFPFQYAFISAPTWRLAQVAATPDYRLPHWPDNMKGIHFLVRIPESGVLDIATAEVLFRRFNIQAEVPQYPFWGRVSATKQMPGVDEIIADLAKFGRAL